MDEREDDDRAQRYGMAQELRDEFLPSARREAPPVPAAEPLGDVPAPPPVGVPLPSRAPERPGVPAPEAPPAPRAPSAGPPPPGAPPGPRMRPPGPRPARSWWAWPPNGGTFAVAVVAVLALLLAASTAVVWTRQGDAQARVEELRDRLDAAEAAQGEQQRENVGFDVRLDQLETALAQQPDVAEVAKKVSPSVFTVEAGDSLGSAFVMQSGGGRSRLVTNFHVVESAFAAGERDVVLRQQDVTFDGTITRVDPDFDLAIIEMGGGFPALERAPARPVQGDLVLVVGSPLGLGNSVASGIVSALREDFIQFSAPVSPGNSGGPLVDRQGRVIGVTTAKVVVEGAEGLSFALDVNRVCQTVLDC